MSPHLPLGPPPSGQDWRVAEARPSNAALVAKVVLAAIFGCLLAVGIIFLGPKETVVCVDAAWPNSLFGDNFGHTDGATFTGCDVPTLATWAAAVGSILIPIALVVASGLWDRRRSAE
jgi:hypothetical protein